MHRAHARDLEESLTLGIIERTSQLDPPFYVVDTSDAGFALRAVLRMKLVVAKMHGYTLQCPLLPIGIHPERHRRTGPKRCQQKIVRRGPGVGTTGVGRFIGMQPMPADLNLLRQPTCAAVHDNGICP